MGGKDTGKGVSDRSLLQLFKNLIDIFFRLGKLFFAYFYQDSCAFYFFRKFIHRGVAALHL